MRPGIKNLAASVLDRLRNHARETDQTFNEVLTYYGLERFLYRISSSQYGDRFVLKGALVMLTWPKGVARLTNDMDLWASIPPDIEQVSEVIREICRTEVEDDAIEFDPATVRSETIVEKANYPGIRTRLTGNINNVRVPIQIDIDFSDPMVPKPTVVDYPAILEQPAPRIRAYRTETIIAEKLEALVYLGDINTRMKDFYDLWEISRRFSFSGTVLVGAVSKTFEARGTEIPSSTPSGLTDEFADENQTLWDAFLERIGNDSQSVSLLSDVASDLRGFLAPVLKAAREDQSFDKCWGDGLVWN